MAVTSASLLGSMRRAASGERETEDPVSDLHPPIGPNEVCIRRRYPFDVTR